MSAVIATYNVARYLPELLTSLERQTYGIENVQLVFVNDGSTDESGAILDAWASSRTSHVMVVHQENQKVAAARNNGLRHVQADWVTFTDPDDVLQDRYFEEIAKFIGLYDDRDLAILATHQMRMDDEGNLTDTHASSKRFKKGSRLVDLRHEPLVQLGAAPAFMRVSVIEENGLQFDHRIRPTFEDSHFVARYIMLSGRNTLGLVASAKYHYRRRADGTSLVQSGYSGRDKYLSVLRYGELDLLRFAAARGPIPRWVENTVLYDLVWYFRNERAIESPSASAPRDVFDEFHSLVSEVLELISADAIISFDVIWVEYAIRLSLLHGYRPQTHRPDLVTLVEVDERAQLVHLAYWFNGETPAERITVDGTDVEPSYETVEDIVFYGRTTMRRRHLWVRRGLTTSLTVDGAPVPFSFGEQPELPLALGKRQLDPKIMRQRAALRDPLDIEEPVLDRAKRLTRKRLRAVRRSVSRTAIRNSAFAWQTRTRKVSDRFAHAWVFMDRDTTANDNAEHMYRWVRKNRPEINAWFVLRRSSQDWDRLEAEGFRLVEFGSTSWRHLLLHADHVASSHIDRYVVSPLDARRYGRPRFLFTFLQHGVINYDMSRWLNTKTPQVFVVSTPGEHAAIAGPSEYKYSAREVMLTGLPRFDELLRKRRAIAVKDRNLIVIAPTWRKYLVGTAAADSNDRSKNPGFMETEYAKAWGDLLRSEGLRELAEHSGKQLAFMPHPNIAPYLEDFDLPEEVKVLSYSENNVQDVLAHAAAFVTDYSSLAFDAAVIDVPMVYFQFDIDQFFSGMHVGRRGYFDYARDGFGDAVATSDEVVGSLEVIAGIEWSQKPVHAERSRNTLITRDELNCERVFRAMAALVDGARPEPPVLQAEAVLHG